MSCLCSLSFCFSMSCLCSHRRFSSIALLNTSSFSNKRKTTSELKPSGVKRTQTSSVKNDASAKSGRLSSTSRLLSNPLKRKEPASSSSKSSGHSSAENDTSKQLVKRRSSSKNDTRKPFIQTMTKESRRHPSRKVGAAKKNDSSVSNLGGS